MTQGTTPERYRYQQACERVELLRGFYGHAVVFAIVNISLIAYNLASSPENLWSLATLFGWGIGLLAHGVYVWGAGRFFGAAWTDRKIREELERSER